MARTNWPAGRPAAGHLAGRDAGRLVARVRFDLARRRRTGAPRPGPRTRTRRSPRRRPTETPNSVPRSITLPCGDSDLEPDRLRRDAGRQLAVAQADGLAGQQLQVGRPFEHDPGPAPEADLGQPAVDPHGPAGPQFARRLAVGPGAVLGVDEPGDRLVGSAGRRAEQPPAEPDGQQQAGGASPAGRRPGRRPAIARRGRGRAGRGRSGRGPGRWPAGRGVRGAGRCAAGRSGRSARRASASARSRASSSASRGVVELAVQIVVDQGVERFGRVGLGHRSSSDVHPRSGRLRPSYRAQGCDRHIEARPGGSAGSELYTLWADRFAAGGRGRHPARVRR